MSIGDYLGIPVIINDYIPPGTIYLFDSSAFRFYDDEREPPETRHPVIQAWLDGEISTEAAIAIALTSKDPALYLWGQEMLMARLIAPENIVKITGI